MAINYTTLFTRLGRLAKWANAWLTYQSTSLLAATTGAADDILDQFEDRRDLVVGLERDVQGFASAAAGWVGRMKTYSAAVLSDLQDDLNAPSASVATILPLLAADMVVNSQTVKACTVGTPTVVAVAGNTGNGQLVVSKKNVDGLDDERILPETVRVVCRSDQYGNGASSGGESFAITGLVDPGPNVAGTPGNGNGPNVAVADAGANLLANGNFDAWTLTDTPDSWTIDAGVVTTNVAEEASTVHRGAGALKLKGDGSTATITLHQAWNTSARSRTIYAAGVWVRKSGTVSSGSNLRVSVKGTGFTTRDLFNADPSTLTTAYAFKSVFFPVGYVIPSDLKVEVTWTAANTAGATAVVLVDDFVLQRPTDFGHVQYALFAGATDFVQGDAFTVATTNDNAGVFQAWFNRFYDVALPSATGGAETIADTLAT